MTFQATLWQFSTSTNVEKTYIFVFLLTKRGLGLTAVSTVQQISGLPSHKRLQYNKSAVCHHTSVYSTTNQRFAITQVSYSTINQRFLTVILHLMIKIHCLLLYRYPCLDILWIVFKNFRGIFEKISRILHIYERILELFWRNSGKNFRPFFGNCVSRPNDKAIALGPRWTRYRHPYRHSDYNSLVPVRVHLGSSLLPLSSHVER